MNTKLIAWITGTLTLLLALFSFVLSFNALTDLAARHHVSIPYLFPLVVEAGVVIFSLNALYRSIHDEHARWQWVLIISSSLLAGTFNVLHAENNLVSQIMAAMPSLFLLLSFESFLNQVKHGVKRSSLMQSLTQLTSELHIKQHELETLTQQFDTLTDNIAQGQTTIEQLRQEIGQLENTQTEQDRSPIEQRRARLIDILSSEGDIGVSALANRLNISRGTVYSDLEALTAEGQVSKNGRGWEVLI